MSRSGLRSYGRTEDAESGARDTGGAEAAGEAAAVVAAPGVAPVEAARVAEAAHMTARMSWGDSRSNSDSGDSRDSKFAHNEVPFLRSKGSRDEPTNSGRPVGRHSWRRGGVLEDGPTLRWIALRQGEGIRWNG